MLKNELVGVYLFGGLDLSCIIVLIVKNYNYLVYIYLIYFGEKLFNELEFFNLVV